MKQRLRETKEKNSILDSIRELRGKVEYILWYIGTIPVKGSDTSDIPGAPGASFYVPTVLNLPPIPTEPETFSQVFWTSSGLGTGDDQVWHSYTGQSRWYPTKFTTLNGTPGV